MAAYAYTAAIDSPHSIQTGGNKNLAVLSGTVDVTNYHTTQAAITEISNAFTTVLDVQLSISDNGFFGRWTGTSIEVWEATGNAGAAEEADVDDDAGVFQFLAVGLQ